MKNWIRLMKKYNQFGNLFIIGLLTTLARSIGIISMKYYPLLAASIQKDGIGMEVWRIVIIIVMTTFFSTVFRWMCKRFGSTVRQNFAHVYRQDLFQKVTKLKMYDLQEMSFPTMNTVISNATDTVNSSLTIPTDIIMDAVSLITGLIIFGMQDMMLTGIVLGVCIIIGIIFHGMFKIMTKLAKIKNDASKELNTSIGRLEGFMTIKLSGTENKEVSMFSESSDKLRRMSLDRFKNMINNMAIIDLCIYFVDLIIIVYCMMVYKNDLPLCATNILIFTNMSYNIFNPILDVNEIVDSASQLSVSINEGLEILDKEEESDGIIELKSFEKDIVFKNVSFSYNDSDDVLTKINLKIKKGEKIGIYGSSGNGKSTMVNLLNRLFRVRDGVIKIDGIDINLCSASSLRKIIGNVTQETYIFSNMTIKENIAYGIDATEDQIIEAAKAAKCHDFIMGLPDKYDSKVGNNGVKLSGGERQRIAIARLLLLNPPILILDEATSKLDNNNERDIKESIDHLAEGKTVIAIAHRLSTLDGYDRLIGIDHHTIAESGTKKELNKPGTIFYELAHQNGGN